LGLYWEYSGTILGLRLKIYRRETAGNEVGMGMKRSSIKIHHQKNKAIIKNFELKK